MKLIHHTADIHSSVKIGEETSVWNDAQIREGTVIGSSCIIAKGVFIDRNTKIGNNVKIQNYASIYHWTTIGNGVFVGPYVCITNDKSPRAITPQGKLKKDKDWKANTTTVQQGASLGAGTIVLPGITIGEYALIGAGSLVTSDVAPYTLLYGFPASVRGYVCKCGTVVSKNKIKPKNLICSECQKI